MTTIQASEPSGLPDNELFGIVYAVTDKQGWAVSEVHDAILAAGYRKPRTVNTAENLEALPFEAVIRDAEGHVLERWGDSEHVQWSTPGCKWFVPATEIALPVTVLYEVQP